MSGQDFTCAFTDGVSLSTWLDPATLTRASRLNPHTGLPHRRYLGTVGVAIEITATVGGVSGEIDANLGGRLFTAWAIEHPQPGPVVLTHPVGQTSVQTFSPTTAGHFAIALRRESGGTVILHVDAETP